MRRRGASFYMLSSIFTWNLKDFNISMHLIHPKLFNLHIWFDNCMVYTKMKKIHIVAPM